MTAVSGKRKRSQAAASADQLAAAFQCAAASAREVVVIATGDGTILYVNRAFETLTGYPDSDVLGQKPQRFLCVPEDPAAFRNALATVHGRRTWHGPIQIATQKGRFLHVEVTLQAIDDEKGNVACYILNGADLTERVEAQRNEQTTQRLDTLRTLVNGIAHRFNNFLASLMGHAELLSLLPDTPPKIKERASKMLATAEAGRRFVEEMKAYSMHTPPGKEQVDLGPLVRQCAEFMQTATQRGITVTVSGPEKDVWVDAVPGEIEQVVLNLLANAVQALGEEHKGTIEVNLQRETHSLPDDENAWSIAVTDDGEGISPECQGRVFEPYFTTRGQALHAGMGLSVGQSIAERHGGFITFTSEPDEGSTFTFVLPALDPATIEKIKSAKGETSSGGGHILLVDDEPMIVSAGEELLATYGYRVSGFTEPGKALEAFCANPDDFQFLLTDLTMPDMNGIELATSLKQLKPDLAVVLCSGFNERIDPADAKKNGIDVIVNKPCPADEMNQALRKAATIVKYIKR